MPSKLGRPGEEHERLAMRPTAPNAFWARDLHFAPPSMAASRKLENIVDELQP